MKKTFIFALAFGIGIVFASGSAEAFKEKADPSPFSYANKLDVQKKLDDAIWRRYFNRYTKHSVRNGIQKNRKFKSAVHNLSKKEKNTSERSTISKRTGALKDVPFYKKRATFSNPSSIRKNAKQVFRKRAIDYYVDGGYANAEALNSDVIYGSTHKVNRLGVLNSLWKRDGVVVNDLRAVQRALYTPPKIGAGQQRQRSINKADRTKLFLHPFMPANYLE